MQGHSLMAAGLSALAAFSATPAVRQVRAAQRHPAPRRTTQQTSVGLTRYSYGPGWGHAQVKRMAKKRKNQRRNKLAHRRAGA